MKKILSLFLVLVMLLSLCACNGGGSDVANEVDAVGKYKSVCLFLDDEYNLNENTTFESSDGRKGTYSVFKKNEIRIKAKNEAEDIWTKNGDFFYSTDSNSLTRVFKKDTEYELKPSFDANGRSNQSFRTGEQDQFNYSKSFELDLKEDGTYTAEYKLFNKHTGSYDSENQYSGTYKFENDILWLSFDSSEYPMLLVNDKLYFDIIEKIE